MAGVGFELRKLFRDQGLISQAKAYAYSSITTIGPMVLCMVLIVAMQWMMSAAGSSFLERELFLATAVYSFIFSVLLTGGLSMVLTRFIADMMFLKKYEHLLSSYYGALSVCLPMGLLVAWLFLRGVSAGLGYKLSAYLFFAELIIIWIQAVYLSALKDYMRIVRHFTIGITITFTCAWGLLHYSPLQGTTAVLVAMNIGFFFILVMSGRHFEQMFPPKDSRLYFQFFAYFRKYPALFFIGTFFYAGVYIHSFIYWFGPLDFIVADRYAISPFYDLPVFYAYLTVIPTLVTFVVSVETSFYEKFRDYYAHILNNGTLQDVMNAKQNMQRTLMQEISFIMELQLLFSLISLAIGIKALPAIGFTPTQLDTFNILVLGYYLFIIQFVVLLLMLYFDDRKGVILISGLFVGLNAGLTLWTMNAGYHGLGIFIAGFITLACALGRLLYYVRNIDYYTFCAQPITLQPKRRFWRRWLPKSASVLAVFMLLTACQAEENAPLEMVRPEEQIGTEADPSSEVKLVEDKRLYERDTNDSLITLYVTVLPDKNDSNERVTWYSLNRITERSNSDELRAIVQEGVPDGSGPADGQFGYGTTSPNAKIGLRGNTSRYAAQKSYKIRLDDQAGLWRDQQVLNLNKHPYDFSRIRNKISFDLFKNMSDMTSLRTQFVHLYVRDLSEGGNDAAPFEDYGLYTHVEQPNKMFLRTHWLDPNGQMYKAAQFEFLRYPDELKLQSDPDYDKAAFETVLEIDGREDHEKLLRMLDDVNDETISFDEVFKRHFDLDNYLTWLASNILMDNMDTNSQNFILYSPLNAEKWFFLPWDYDGGWGFYDDVPFIDRGTAPWQYGVSNYWGVTLHKRFLRNPDNVELLGNKIVELAEQLNEERIRGMVDSYRAVITPFLNRAPDINFLTEPVAQLDEELDSFASIPAARKASFFEQLEKPMPIYLGVPSAASGRLQFQWDLSYDFQKDDLYYDWAIASDPAFLNILQSAEGLTGTTYDIDPLPPGDYFWRILIRDSKGNEQIPFDSYEDESGDHYHGVSRFKVE
ncbi:exopolysaccharide Pel transporter PelG [Paenibacillus abyssi]|uniref:Spore coat protein n=1 Tax=Paenibacillus abyssi TaxID=1340531 RepID=A0A917CP41_9BACL|nr:exopolysaccharide Pel transporter PelG [Paenibacillus abyssi]GGF92552.1 hypothetical protein GCM10010916_07440 [Paenibacillus abyssi]